MNESQKIRTAVVIVAAGKSARIGGNVRKQYVKLGNGAVLSEAIKPFLKSLDCAVLAIAIPEDEDGSAAKNALFIDDEMNALMGKTRLLFVPGGLTRQISVKNALEKIAETQYDGLVLIHDAARPFVDSALILRTAQKAAECGAAVPIVPPSDTQKIINNDSVIIKHLPRESMAAVQTPQAFDFKRILDAHRRAEYDDCAYTDDSEIWDRYEGRVYVVQGDVKNKKITYAKDIENIVGTSAALPCIETRIGIGYDIHTLVSARPLIIGGIVVPFGKGEAGHSDGDALLHAVTDAVLGAAGEGDIGSLFPPNDDAWLGAPSTKLLKITWQKIAAHGWNLVNLDCVIKLEAPKLLPYRNAIRTSIADVLGVETERVFVKAKTGEKLGDIGEGRAIEAWCVCLLEKTK